MAFLAFLTIALLSGQLPVKGTEAAQCGQRPLAPGNTPLVVGGHEVNPSFTWPFVCSLQNKHTQNHNCGGTVITNSKGEIFFITAAHCITDAAWHMVYQAVCASHDLTSSSPPHRVILTFNKISRHAWYNPNTFHNDVAILHVENQHNLSDYLQPACLATAAHTPGEVATVIGWGRLSEGGPLPSVLHEASKPLLSDAACGAADVYGSMFIPSSMLCAGLLGQGGVDSCHGDSGGPLVAERDGKWALVGVVSWGMGCARPDKPGVYADVYKLQGWINDVINN